MSNEKSLYRVSSRQFKSEFAMKVAKFEHYLMHKERSALY
jgi:hypothetical protein